MSGNFVFGADKLTVKYAAIAASASGNNTVVAAVAGKKIRVLAYTLVANGTVTAKFQSGAGGADLSGAKAMTTNTVLSPSYCPVGHFETAAGALLNLSLGGAVAVSGHLTYVEIP
jgi:hypothetical protein